MAAPPVLRDVFNAHIDAFGEDDAGIVFDDGPPPLGRLDVLVYRPTSTVDMTTFVTVGMSVEPMPTTPGPGDGGRAELQFSRLGAVSREDEHAIAQRLANLAAYPWVTGEQVNWGHLVGLNSDFPTFPGCTAVFLSGPLTNTGRDYIRTSEGAVRIINVIPVTADERAQARTMAPIPFIQDLMASVNIFTARS